MNFSMSKLAKNTLCFSTMRLILQAKKCAGSPWKSIKNTLKFKQYRQNIC